MGITVKAELTSLISRIKELCFSEEVPISSIVTVKDNLDKTRTRILDEDRLNRQEEETTRKLLMESQDNLRREDEKRVFEERQKEKDQTDKVLSEEIDKIIKGIDVLRIKILDNDNIRGIKDEMDQLEILSIQAATMRSVIGKDISAVFSLRDSYEQLHYSITSLIQNQQTTDKSMNPETTMKSPSALVEEVDKARQITQSQTDEILRLKELVSTLVMQQQKQKEANDKVEAEKEGTVKEHKGEPDEKISVEYSGQEIIREESNTVLLQPIHAESKLERTSKIEKEVEIKNSPQTLIVHTSQSNFLTDFQAIGVSLASILNALPQLTHLPADRVTAFHSKVILLEKSCNNQANYTSEDVLTASKADLSNILQEYHGLEYQVNNVFT